MRLRRSLGTLLLVPLFLSIPETLIWPIWELSERLVSFTLPRVNVQRLQRRTDLDSSGVVRLIPRRTVRVLM